MGKLSFAAFSVNGSAERGAATTEQKNVHCLQKEHQIRKMCRIVL